MLRTKKGFTLIELMVVIVIIGILAALAIPKFTGASAKAKMGEAPTVLAAYETAELAYIQETGDVATALSKTTFDSTSASGSKWFGYGYAATAGSDAVYTATATKDIGTFLKTKTLTSKVTTAGAVTHGGDTALAHVYIPNF